MKQLLNSQNGQRPSPEALSSTSSSIANAAAITAVSGAGAEAEADNPRLRASVDEAGPQATPRSNDNDRARHEGSSSAHPGLELQMGNPLQLLTDEVKTSYLRCSGNLDDWLLWAILALATRFSRPVPGQALSPSEISNIYASRARETIQAEIGTASLSRIQSLLLLTGHDWGAGNGRRAWLYLGMAIRMVQILDLWEEDTRPADSWSSQEFIVAEARRRTAWTCFLIESLLSGGKGRKRTLTSKDMLIQLPCDDESFVFGSPVVCERLDGSVAGAPRSKPIGQLGILAYSIRVADIWGDIASWACSNTVDCQKPWDETSEFHQINRSLEAWKFSLPGRLRYSSANLHAHSSLERGQSFCYMHSIYFMSLIFLHRAYLPPSALPKSQGPSTSNVVLSAKIQDYRANQQWYESSSHQLFTVAAAVCDMIRDLKTFGLQFLRGLVPWIGFTVYTATGVMLYLHKFPSADGDADLVNASRQRALNGSAFLKEMHTQWPMAQQWFENLQRIQAFYNSIRSDNIVTPAEHSAVKSAMVDYGALQPSPVSQRNDSPLRSLGGDSASPPISATRTEDIVLESIPQALTDEMDTADSSLFDFDAYDNNLDFQQLLADATQEFWASFPGEVDLGIV
ncbi:MAG: hypothetical protein M1819_000446 [Sarea resinae]|nr:MAG: hypothetical protein M1819_000446 [Sarea resinae]